ncbi:MAG: CDP-diacylglycerol--glycerol-3-phosphate 3-phosphatidyltransferase [Ignavibacteria bacterium]|nr:CDP-diacylglycerol--glycerol-3-phosphate 3-phosphatidyltransferase [Ignavibacteria bacterium]MBT8382031.1 CDP-diacylglycerol--glycerol-3-phosphate 3-phosphatidyltransferase [Ignavibacteria bacterium]MBT8390834.1 CDP-diacylglycerol--glycerol-3-phosphate 3-phosphatidyltransferase [Ignavibacteria bacterium]NNL21216.1 CDP-diacylglycerol--glycerol-3-phosphate 3-phosphatidyltransferase [Ignavibacteriaceae bacterium]
MTLPNQLTILRIILSPIFLYFFLSEEIWMKQVSVLIYIVAALSDWYDGWLARKFNYITSWGKFWDPLADKILTSFAFIAFALMYLIPWWMVIIIVARDLLVTILRVYADTKNFIFSTSYYAKWKTLIQMIFLYYLIILFVAKSTPQIYLKYQNIISLLLSENLIYFIALTITVITLHSGFIYIKRNWPIIKKLIKIAN